MNNNQKRNNNSPDITILINSCDLYKDAWEPFIKLFYIQWKDCPYPIAINTESIEYNGEYSENVKTFFSTNKDITWSGRLRSCLEKVETEYVLFILDDYFVQNPVAVTYFPQLIAGPIVTHDEMVPQFADVSKKKFNYDNFAAGLYGFALGLGKKVIIADSFGLFVDAGFADVSNLGTVNALLVMLAYTFQIYFDFSGYCDMATGIGKMMNIDITMNFNSPYKAININDFWKRWHITLTRFFTRYVYIPLGGNRKGTVRTYVNIMIVFLVSGIWHGANWTFIVWGLLHAVAQVLTRILDKTTGIYSKHDSKVINVISWIFTFAFVNLAWVIFRAESLNQAGEFFGQLLNFKEMIPSMELLKAMSQGGFELIGHYVPKFNILLPIGLFGFALFASVFMKNTNERILTFKPSYPKVLVTSVMLFWCIMSFAGVSSFLYWNF